MGEWKNAATDAEARTFITEGKQDLVSKYNEATRSVLINNGTRKIPVLYVPDTNEIVVSAGGKGEKFTRVK